MHSLYDWAGPSVIALVQTYAQPYPTLRAQQDLSCVSAFCSGAQANSEEDEPMSLMERLAMRGKPSGAVPGPAAVQPAKKVAPSKKAAAAKKAPVVDSESEEDNVQVDVKPAVERPARRCDAV